MKLWFALLFSLALPALEAAPSVYRGDPLPVLLPVGQERRIEIEGAREIHVGMSTTLRTQLQAESVGPHLWLTAQEDLAPQRLYLDTGAGTRVLEIRTDAQAPTTPLKIAANPVPGTGAAEISAPRPLGYVALMRHAIQALYAPDFREAPAAGIRQRPLERKPVAMFRCRAQSPSACGGAVEAIPHTAWEAAPYHVTAVTLRNLLPVPLVLDPRDIRARVLASAFVHPRLEAAGSARDATTLVLISSTPFEHVQ